MAFSDFGLQAENISTIVKAAGVSVEPYWPGLFAKLFEKNSIANLITNVGAGELLLHELQQGGVKPC